MRPSLLSEEIDIEKSLSDDGDRVSKLKWSVKRLQLTSWWIGWKDGMLGIPLVVPHQDGVETAQVQFTSQGRLQIVFGDKFVDSIPWDEVRAGFISFVLAHEGLHLASKHIERSSGKNMRLWNICTDLLINEHLLRYDVGAEIIPIVRRRNLITDETLRKTDPDIWKDLAINAFHTMDAEDVYNWVYDRIIEKTRKEDEERARKEEESEDEEEQDDRRPIQLPDDEDEEDDGGGGGEPPKKPPKKPPKRPPQPPGGGDGPERPPGGYPPVDNPPPPKKPQDKNKRIDRYLDEKYEDIEKMFKELDESRKRAWDKAKEEGQGIIEAINENRNRVFKGMRGTIDPTKQSGQQYVGSSKNPVGAHAGNMPGKELITIDPSVVRNSPEGWKHVLKTFIRSIAASKFLRDRNFNKEWAAMRGLKSGRLGKLRLPDNWAEKKDMGPRLLVFIDNSGSMQGVIDDVVGVVATAPKHLTIEYYSFDTMVHEAPGLREAFKSMTKYKLPGGGGTDISPIADFVDDYRKNKRVDGVLVFTDGYFTAVDVPVAEKWLFMITTDGSAEEIDKIRSRTGRIRRGVAYAYMTILTSGV